jgi:transposase-like protein
MREIRRRTRVVGAFPDGNSALILVCARLRYIAGKNWGVKRYMDMQRLQQHLLEQPTAVSNSA